MLAKKTHEPSRALQLMLALGGGRMREEAHHPGQLVQSNHVSRKGEKWMEKVTSGYIQFHYLKLHVCCEKSHC